MKACSRNGKVEDKDEEEHLGKKFEGKFQAMQSRIHLPGDTDVKLKLIWWDF